MEENVHWLLNVLSPPQISSRSSHKSTIMNEISGPVSGEDCFQRILLAHDEASRDSRRRRSDRGGGVLPVCVDEQGTSFALLGEGSSSELSSFGGWIDAGETTPQGCAREFWEESRGAIVSHVDAWRAISLAPEFARPLPSKKPNRFTFVVFLGTMGDEARMKLQKRFLRTIAWDSASGEVRSLHFVPLLQLRQHCTEKICGSPLRLSSASGMSSSAGLKIRPFLHQWLANEELWDRLPWLKNLTHSGAPCCRSLSELPELQDDDNSNHLRRLASMNCHIK